MRTALQNRNKFIAAIILQGGLWLCFPQAIAQTVPTKPAARQQQTVQVHKQQWHVYMGPAILQRPKIQASPNSQFQLQPKIPLSLIAGIGKELINDQNWSLLMGLQLQLIHNRYQLHIPDNNLPGLLSTNGAPQIQEKQLYYVASLPLKISRTALRLRNSSFSCGAGAQLNYSGFSIDERSTTSMADSNRRMHTLFTAETKSSNNNKKPWVSAMVFVSNKRLLKNRHLVNIELQFTYSPGSFLQTNYSITPPNNQPSNGTYKVAQSFAGLLFYYSLRRTVIDK